MNQYSKISDLLMFFRCSSSLTALAFKLFPPMLTKLMKKRYLRYVLMYFLCIRTASSWVTSDFCKTKKVTSDEHYQKQGTILWKFSLLFLERGFSLFVPYFCYVWYLSVWVSLHVYYVSKRPTPKIYIEVLCFCWYFWVTQLGELS